MSFVDKTVELLPAYGRSYETQKSFKKDWLLEKDFSIKKGPYTSRRDIDMMISDGIETIFIKINHTNIYIVRFGIIQKWANK